MKRKTAKQSSASLSIALLFQMLRAIILYVIISVQGKMNMDLIKLSYFIKAAEYSNFSIAAQECRIAQTAMSRHIAGMEKELGVELFKRFPKKVVLSPAGEVFSCEAKEIVKKYNDAVSRLRDIASGCDDRLNIGFGFFERSLLSEYIRSFAKTNQGISISISQHPYDRLMQELKVGNCDVIFCPPNWAGKLENTRSIALRPNLNCIALSKTHPLAEFVSLSPQLISGETIIIPEYDAPFDGFRRMCESCGIKPKKVITVNTLEAMISTIETNVGVALVPSYIMEDYKNIEFRPFTSAILNDKRHVALCLKPPLKHATTLLMDEIAHIIETESRFDNI